jgi:hypothetical protein
MKYKSYLIILLIAVAVVYAANRVAAVKQYIGPA